MTSPSEMPEPVQGKDIEVGPAKAENTNLKISNTTTVPYSSFSPFQKRIITIFVGVGSLFSPMSANIYFPSLQQLQSDLQTSAQLINLTITIYIIFQGIAPAFFGELADTVGRRPVYLLTFCLYIAANLGLALQRNYTALLILRIFQSLGCSATVAIGYGVVADVATPAQRGGMLGLSMILTNAGPSLGPLLGGVLVEKAHWPWVFWFLLIIGVCYVVALLIFMPETNRKIVDNGSLIPHGLHQTIYCQLSKKPKASLSPVKSKYADRMAWRSVRAPNPFRSIRIIFYKDTALVLYMSAAFYTVYYCVQASMPAIFTEIYDLSSLHVGLTYLSIGGGVVLGGFGNGKLLDRNYGKTAREIDHEIDHVAGDDMSMFPIEYARSRSTPSILVFCIVVLAGYGWMVEQRMHIAAPIIFQFLLGFLTTVLVQTFNTLLVDIFSSSPSTAAAAGNLTRCAMSAGGVAAMEPIYASIGFGWFFTALALFAGLTSSAALCLIRLKGRRWRQNRQAAPVQTITTGSSFNHATGSKKPS